MRRLWLGRALGVDASGAARWLRFWFLPLLFLFLVSGVPAVLDFRQEFPNSFDALLTPSMHFQIAQLDGLRCRHSLLAASRVEMILITTTSVADSVRKSQAAKVDSAVSEIGSAL